jgi:hypothetical protein
MTIEEMSDIVFTFFQVSLMSGLIEDSWISTCSLLVCDLCVCVCVKYMWNIQPHTVLQLERTYLKCLFIGFWVFFLIHTNT